MGGGLSEVVPIRSVDVTQVLLVSLGWMSLGCAGSSTQAATSDAGTDGVSSPAPDGACPDGFVPAAASCGGGEAGISACGACGDSCCASLLAPGGSYQRQYISSDGGPTGEAHPATVSGLYMDRYEVTVGRFRRFVGAWNAGWRPSAGSGKHTSLNGGSGLNATGGGYEPGWNVADDANVAPTDANLACYSGTWTPMSEMGENQPINCVNWYEAYAFCIWDGGFLPSEAEWEFAAAGGSEQREYPWGSTDPGTASVYEIYSCFYPSGSGPCTGAGNLAPVGTAAEGGGLWGQLDLAGNVEEWGLDWYAVPYSDPCTDCAYLTPATRRVVRGGNFFEYAAATLASYRDGSPPKTRSAYYGLRCARESP